MHILEIPSFFTPYGGEFCLEQAKALAALGHDVRILSNVQLGATIGLRDYLFLSYSRYEYQCDGITVYQSFQRGLPHMVRHNAMHWIDIVKSMFVTYVEKYGKPDVIHAHCVKWAGYTAMLICKEYGIPYVITEHLSKQIYKREFGAPPYYNWQIPLLKQALREADTVITVSKELVEELSEFFGTDYRSTFISNTIDVDFFLYRERSLDLLRPFRFCCLGFFDERKGYDILLSAFDKLVKRNKNFELHIAGRGTDSKHFKNLYKQMNSKSSIFALGELSKTQVRDLLYDCDALVLATRDETQGLVLLEALSTGIPVISTETIPKSVRLDEASYFVPVDDIDAMADMMERISHREFVYDGRKTSQLVCAMASPETVGKQLAAVLSAACHR